MGDYGFRISKNGVDVKTGDDKDMVMTSKYPVLKGSLNGSGSVTVNVNGGPATVTIAHNLGYAPIPKAYAQESGFGYYVEMPVYDYITVTEFDQYQFSWIIESDSTNVYLKFEYEELLGDPLPATVGINYTYSINVDKGNLS